MTSGTVLGRGIRGLITLVVRHEIFESDWDSWVDLFDRAANIASRIGRDRLIGISQSESPNRKGVVTVWYWDKAAYEPEVS